MARQPVGLSAMDSADEEDIFDACMRAVRASECEEERQQRETTLAQVAEMARTVDDQDARQTYAVWRAANLAHVLDAPARGATPLADEARRARMLEERPHPANDVQALVREQRLAMQDLLWRHHQQQLVQQLQSMMLQQTLASQLQRLEHLGHLAALQQHAMHHAAMRPQAGQRALLPPLYPRPDSRVPAATAALACEAPATAATALPPLHQPTPPPSAPPPTRSPRVLSTFERRRRDRHKPPPPPPRELPSSEPTGLTVVPSIDIAASPVSAPLASPEAVFVPSWDEHMDVTTLTS